MYVLIREMGNSCRHFPETRLFSKVDTVRLQTPYHRVMHRELNRQLDAVHTIIAVGEVLYFVGAEC